MPSRFIHIPMGDFFGVTNHGKRLVPVLSGVDELLATQPEEKYIDTALVLSANVSSVGEQLSYEHKLSHLPLGVPQPLVSLNGVESALHPRFDTLGFSAVYIRTQDGRFLQLYACAGTASELIHDYFREWTLLPSGVVAMPAAKQAEVKATMDEGEVLEFSTSPSGHRYNKRITLPKVGALDEIEVEKILRQARKAFETGKSVVFYTDLDDSLVLNAQTLLTGTTILNPAILDFASRLRELCVEVGNTKASFKMQLITSRKLPGMSQLEMNTAVSQWIKGEADQLPTSPFSVQAIIEAMPTRLKSHLVHACPHTQAKYVTSLSGETKLNVLKRDAIADHYLTHEVGKGSQNKMCILMDDNPDECVPWADDQSKQFAERGISFHPLAVNSNDTVSTAGRSALAERTVSNPVYSALRRFSIAASSPPSADTSIPVDIRPSSTPIAVRA